jgi:hypothetical protein
MTYSNAVIASAPISDTESNQVITEY